MKRSVILMGGKTYVISLPSQWVKKYKVQKGEELEVEEKDNSIVVSTDNISKGDHNEVNLVGLDRMLRRVLAAAYKSGTEQIKIIFDGKDQLQKIENVLHKAFIGFEITQQGENYVHISNLTQIDPKEYCNSLRRIFYSLEVMHDDLLEAMKNNDKDQLKLVVEKDEQINRLADFCRRVINSGNIQGIDKPSIHYYIIEQLERIGDVHKKVANYILDSNTKVNSDVSITLSQVKTFFSFYHKLFYNFSLPEVEKFGLTFNQIKEKLRNMHETTEKDQIPLLIYNELLLENIFDMNGALITLQL